MRSLSSLGALMLLAGTSLLMVGCGSKAAAPKPTATAAATTVPAAVPASVQAARRFLNAYRHGQKRGMIALMTPALLQRNLHEFVSDMLGVAGNPQGITVLRAYTFRKAKHPWTLVVTRIDLDHGSVTDRLGVVRTLKGWKVNSIRQVKQKG